MTKPQALADDLRDFEQSDWYAAPNDLSGHWEHFRAAPAAGIDADTTLNPFVKAVIEEWLERVRNAIEALRGAQTQRYSRVFEMLWPNGPLGLDYARRKGLRYTPGSILAVHHANNILSHIRPNTILEIGAGIGELARVMRLFCHAQLFIVDVPETISIAAPRLTDLGSIALPHQAPNRDINFFVPSQFDRVPQVDLAINIASMQEMRPAEIARYFVGIWDRAKYFYCVNRVEKWLSDTVGSADAPGATHDYAVRFHEYPWADCEDVFYRISRFHRLVGAEPVFERLSRLCRGNQPMTASQ